MPETVRLTEADLRAAIRDPRYWPPNPDRDAFASWVTDGYRALGASRLRTSDGTAIVHVRAYTRVRDGVAQHVGEHQRGVAEGGDGDGLLIPVGRRSRRRYGSMADDPPRTIVTPSFPDPDLTAPLRIFPPGVSGGRGRRGAPVIPGVYQERRRNLSGKERADDVPTWARGRAPYVNETPEAFATRLMNERYPQGWRQDSSSRGSTSEFSQIQKSARGWRNPSREEGAGDE